MELSAADIVLICDRIGIVAFAFSGVEAGLRRRLDLFGLVVLGVITATGGGLVRDVILGRLPFVLTHEDYLLLAAGSSLAAILVAGRRPVPRLPLAIADAAGLGAFAVAGAFAAITAGLPWPAVMAMAMLTATGGGAIRDLLADRVPLVLHSEVNATAAALGGLTVWAVDSLSVGAAALAGVAVTATVRGAGLALGLQLPTPGGRSEDETGA